MITISSLNKQKEYQKRYKEKHPDKVRESGRRYRDTHKENVRKWEAARYCKKRDIIWDIKRRPCADCGIQFHPMIMEFDHVNGDKKFTISNMIRSTSLDKLLEEVTKCDVVCANCHRLREAKKKGHI